jgi:hypothetical protein
VFLHGQDPKRTWHVYVPVPIDLALTVRIASRGPSSDATTSSNIGILRGSRRHARGPTPTVRVSRSREKPRGLLSGLGTGLAARPRLPTSGGSVMRSRPSARRFSRPAAPQGAGQKPSISVRIDVKTLGRSGGSDGWSSCIFARYRGRGVKFIGRRKFQIRSGLGGGAVAAFPDPGSHKVFVSSSPASSGWSSRFPQRQEYTIGSGVIAFEAFDEVSAARRHVLFRGVLGGEGGRIHLSRRCSILTALELTALDGISGSLRRGKAPWDELSDGSSVKGPLFRSAGTTVEMKPLLSAPVHFLSTKEKQ